MALPALWTESSLIAAVEAELEPVTADLGLDTLDVVFTAVSTDVPSVLNVSSVESVSYGSVADVVKVLTIAKWAAWQKAVDVASVRFDLDDQGVKQSQIWKMLSARLSSAERAAMRYSEAQDALGGGAMAYTSSISTAGDPYPFPVAVTEFG